ncbi:MAG: RagB/SusD family nutrient uptake outer membrane protein [Gemmatimonadaceae bacterium]
MSAPRNPSSRSVFAGRTRGIRATLAAALLCVPGLFACSELLEQEAPSRVPAELLDDPAYAVLRVRSAVGDFECALAQYVVATARVSDEFVDSQFAESGWDYDRRSINPVRGGPYATTSCDGGILNPGYYVPLSVARFQADAILRLLEGWTDEQVASRDSLIAVAAVYAGYSLVYMGETMCTGAIDIGPELTTDQLLTEAEIRFTRAIEAATAAGVSDIVALAHLGRARARRGLGDLAGARADAALVPQGFVFEATYSSAAFRRENRVNTQFFREFGSTVGPEFRDLEVGGVPDPRVDVFDTGEIGHDNSTPVFATTKYPDVSSPIPIGRYEEAQLIIAEAEIEAGDPDAAIAIINARRTELGLPTYTGPNDAASVLALLIDERKRELFLEGHRLADIIRYDLPLVPPPGTPFPKGSEFGSQLCFPLPDVERLNNPNIPD